MKMTPATRGLIRPNGMTFSSSTKNASAAIQNESSRHRQTKAPSAPSNSRCSRFRAVHRAPAPRRGVSKAAALERPLRCGRREREGYPSQQVTADEPSCCGKRLVVCRIACLLVHAAIQSPSVGVDVARHKPKVRVHCSAPPTPVGGRGKWARSTRQQPVAPAHGRWNGRNCPLAI